MTTGVKGDDMQLDSGSDVKKDLSDEPAQSVESYKFESVPKLREDFPVIDQALTALYPVPVKYQNKCRVCNEPCGKSLYCSKRHQSTFLQRRYREKHPETAIHRQARCVNLQKNVLREKVRNELKKFMMQRSRVEGLINQYMTLAKYSNKDYSWLYDEWFAVLQPVFMMCEAERCSKRATCSRCKHCSAHCNCMELEGL